MPPASIPHTPQVPQGRTRGSVFYLVAVSFHIPPVFVTSHIPLRLLLLGCTTSYPHLGEKTDLKNL